MIEPCCGETYFDWAFDGQFLTLKQRATSPASQWTPPPS